MTVGRITFGPAEPYSAPDLRRRGSVRGFDPAALAPTPSPEHFSGGADGVNRMGLDVKDGRNFARIPPSPCGSPDAPREINPPRDIAPVQEWRIVPQTVNGIMPPVCFVPRADFEGLPKEWPADTAWKTEANR